MYAVLARCRRAARQAKWPEARTAAFLAEAQSGDYDHALQTCMRWFDVR